MSVVTILVVDEAPHWRKFVSFVLRIDPALEIVSEASDGAYAVEQSKEIQPAIVLLDIALPDISGIEAGRRIRKHSPGSKIIFVSRESEIEVVQQAIDLGAMGFVSKLDAGSQLVTAIHSAIRGKTFLSSSLPPAAGTKH
jgi:DNA-binding NarL/FixJ family response regulator